MLPFVIIGLTSGSVFALAGVGMVLTYKTSRLLNFAHGALAAVSAYVFYALFVLDHWPWPLAAIAAIALVGPAMGFAFEFLARRIQRDALTLRVAATVGVFLVVEATIYLIYGTQTVRTVPLFLGSGTLRVGGANVQVAQIVTFAFSLAVTLGLTAYLRFTGGGAAMRAVVDDAELLDANGISATRTHRTAWMIGVTLAAASGVLFAPLLPLDPLDLTLLVASAFGAAAIGTFTNLPLTFIGGLVIGVLAALCTKWFTGISLLGLAPAIPFIVVLAVVFVAPRRLLRGDAGPRPHLPSTRSVSRPDLAGGAALLAALLLVPLFAGVHLTDWTTFVATSIVFMSLGLLVRTSGQAVLCQVAFMALGAAAFSHLTSAGVPWLAALFLAGLIAVPVGLLLSVPAIRLPGVYLALATFAFGIVLQDVFYTASYMFGSSGLGINEPLPDLSWLSLHGARSFYYVVLAVAVLCAVLVMYLTRNRFGRLSRGIAQAPLAVQVSGADVGLTRTTAFAIAGFLASIGGALAGVSQGTAVSESYQPILSLTYLAAIVIVPGGALLSAVLAAAGLVLVPSYFPGFNVATVLQLVFGASVILYALLPERARTGLRFPRRVIDTQRGWLPARLRVAAASRPVSPSPTTARTVKPESNRVPPGDLFVRMVTVTLERRTVLAEVSLTAKRGHITGLIGPNGAGKTTVINVCSGQLDPHAGCLSLGELDLQRQGPSARARLGLRRTFQRPELFESLTVRENVEAGGEAILAGSNPIAHLTSRRRDRQSIHTISASAIEQCGLVSVADVPVIELSPGHRRLVELARCLAGPCSFLLLDEPCAGLSRAERDRVGSVLRRVAADRGIGVLLVEHDMPFALDVCDWFYVLDSGRVIFEGVPSEVVFSRLVQSTYLGAALIGAEAT